jgi:hypothetical protein
VVDLASEGVEAAVPKSARETAEAVAHLFAHDQSDRIVGDEWVYCGSPEAAGGGPRGNQDDALEAAGCPRRQMDTLLLTERTHHDRA